MRDFELIHSHNFSYGTLSRVWPAPINAIDPAKQFERYLTNYWYQSHGSGLSLSETKGNCKEIEVLHNVSPFEAPLKSAWCEEGQTPLIVHNATLIRHGRPVGFTLFVLDLKNRKDPNFGAEWSPIFNFWLPWSKDVAVSTAVSTSVSAKITASAQC